MTARDGTFVFHGVAEGHYAIAVGGDAVAREADVQLAVDRDRDDVRVEVDLGRTVRGRVEPPRAATLVVPRDADGISVWDAQTESATDGTFALHNVPTGNQVLRAFTADGHATDDPLAGDGDVVDLVVRLATHGDATLAAHVIDEDGQPVPFARFAFLSPFAAEQPMQTQMREVTADGQGRLVVPNLVANVTISMSPVDHVLAGTADLVVDGRDHAIVVRRPPAG